MKPSEVCIGMVARTILLVEDDPDVLRSLERRFRFEGFRVLCAERGEDALCLLSEDKPDLVLLDVMLPGMDGFTTVEHIRRSSNVPIVMLTAKDSLADRVGGFERGADDYVVKPFEMPELIARVRALIRRTLLSSSVELDGCDSLSFADISLNRATREVFRAGSFVELTLREFDLLEHFLRHPRQVLTRDQLLEAVWGYEVATTSNLVDVYVRQLRKKLYGESAEGTRRIQAVRGVGYVLRDYDSTRS